MIAGLAWRRRDGAPAAGGGDDRGAMPACRRCRASPADRDAAPADTPIVPQMDAAGTAAAAAAASVGREGRGGMAWSVADGASFVPDRRPAVAGGDVPLAGMRYAAHASPGTPHDRIAIRPPGHVRPDEAWGQRAGPASFMDAGALVRLFARGRDPVVVGVIADMGVIAGISAGADIARVRADGCRDAPARPPSPRSPASLPDRPGPALRDEWMRGTIAPGWRWLTARPASPASGAKPWRARIARGVPAFVGGSRFFDVEHRNGVF